MGVAQQAADTERIRAGSSKEPGAKRSILIFQAVGVALPPTIRAME